MGEHRHLDVLRRRATAPGEASYDAEVDSEIVGWAVAEIERLTLERDTWQAAYEALALAQHSHRKQSRDSG